MWPRATGHGFETRVIKKNSLLGAFAELRKVTISFVMSVCPFVCSHGITRLPLDRFL